MGGSSKPATTTSKTTNDPWAPAQPLLQDMIQRASVAYNATPKTGTYVDPNATQLAAADSMRAAASGMDAGVPELRNLGVATARGDFLSPDSNPFIKGAVDAAINPLRDRLDQNVMSIGDAAQAAGAYGGSRQALLKSTALQGFNADALDTSAGIYADNYARERQLQQGAPQLLSSANQLALQPGQVLGAVGDQEQQWAMDKLVSAMDAPWAGLDRYQSILNSVSPYGTTSGTTTSTAAQKSKGGSALSGALGGASAGASFGPWGAGIGAIAGGLGGLFG